MNVTIDVIFTLFLLNCVELLHCQNTLWVSNQDNRIEVDHTDLQEAIDAAGSGDRIMVYPSPTSYGDVVIDKELYISGLGFDISANHDTHRITTETQSSLISKVSVTGAQGGSLEHLMINTIELTATGFLIKGVRIGFMEMENCHDVVIRRCFIDPPTQIDSRFLSGAARKRHCSIILSGDNSQIAIENSIFDGSRADSPVDSYHNVYQGYSSSYDGDIPGSSSNFTFDGNFLGHSVNTIPGSQFYNNIGRSMGGTNSILENNYSSSTFEGVFVGYPTQSDHSFDQRYQLAPGSPALGAGRGGIDLGPFGGEDPYILSGLYDRPVVYQLDIPQNETTNSLDVRIKVRIND